MKKVLVTTIFLLFSNLALSKGMALEEQLKLVKLFFKIVEQHQDIEDKFAKVTDDFVYIHHGYGGEYSRQDLYNGFVRNFKRGMYKDNKPILIEGSISGLNMIVVKRKSGKTTLFEFRDNKIARIKEFW